MSIDGRWNDHIWAGLSCPRHPAAGELRLAADRSALECRHCGAEYAIRDEVAGLVHDGADDTFQIEARQWDRLADDYEQTRGQDPRYMAAITAAVAALDARPGESVLDAGCGTGLTTRRLAGLGLDLTALDVSHASLRFLHGRLGGRRARLVRGDLAALPFPDQSFDRILCANVLQQVEGHAARRACVAELHRVLRPGGRLVVTVQQFSLPRRRAGWVKEGSTGHGVRYIYRFDRGEFQDLLATDFVVRRPCGAGFPLPYRLKLATISRFVERVAGRVPAAARFGDLLVGIGIKRPDVLGAGADSNPTGERVDLFRAH